MAKSLVEVLKEQGVELIQSSGERLVAHCPFHEGDESPSFTVYETGTYFCFGCKVWGDAYKFLIDKGWTHRDAIEYLGEDYKIKDKLRPGIIKIRNRVEMCNLLTVAAEQYHQFLLASPGALNYVLDRGINMDTLVRHRIGYSDGYTLRIKWAEDMSVAQQIGLVSGSGNEMLSHRIIIPNLFDGKCDFLVGRTVTNEKVKYLGIRVPKPLYGFYEVRHSSTIFVVEGQFDWLSLRQWRYPAVAIGGTHPNSQTLIALQEKKIVIVPDNDETGMKMAKSLQEKFKDSLILNYKNLGVKDISELATIDGGKEAFNQLVGEQVPWNISEIH